MELKSGLERILNNCEWHFITESKTKTGINIEREYITKCGNRIWRHSQNRGCDFSDVYIMWSIQDVTVNPLSSVESYNIDLKLSLLDFDNGKQEVKDVKIPNLIFKMVPEFKDGEKYRVYAFDENWGDFGGNSLILPGYEKTRDTYTEVYLIPMEEVD